jgi:lipid A 3-O-deacylase
MRKIVTIVGQGVFDMVSTSRFCGMLCAAALVVVAGSRAALADDPPFLAVGAGYFDVGNNQEAAEFRVEYRGPKLLWAIKPVLGVMATSDAAFYGYGGLAMDFYLGRRWVITPSLAAGAYRKGNGKDLGHTVEFRSAIEAAYRFDNRSRLGLTLYHLSNASIGDKNPGTEVLGITYAIPIN